MGILQCESSNLSKSFVEASSCQIDKCQELASLSRRHECLLHVEHYILHPTDESKKLLVTEPVYPVHEFFSIEYQKFKSEFSNKGLTWWDHIYRNYWTIFRDVSRGLIFLYEKTEHVCGDLTLNTFVTVEGSRGRILPSADMSKKGSEDVMELIDLMRTIVSFPFEGKPNTADLSIPTDLSRLFDFIPHNLNLPSSFLVDHPFFWTTGDKIDFAPTFKKFIRKDEQLTDMEIEKGLMVYFPDYYVTIFECLCVCLHNGNLNMVELKEVSSIDFRDDET